MRRRARARRSCGCVRSWRACAPRMRRRSRRRGGMRRRRWRRHGGRPRRRGRRLRRWRKRFSGSATPGSLRSRRQRRVPRPRWRRRGGAFASGAEACRGARVGPARTLQGAGGGARSAEVSLAEARGEVESASAEVVRLVRSWRACARLMRRRSRRRGGVRRRRWRRLGRRPRRRGRRSRRWRRSFRDSASPGRAPPRRRRSAAGVVGGGAG